MQNFRLFSKTLKQKQSCYCIPSFTHLTLYKLVTGVKNVLT